MRIVLIILSTLVSVQLSNAQVILNEAALQNVDIYNFKEINSSTLEFSPVPFQVGILYISPQKKRSKYDRGINEGYFKIRYASGDNQHLDLSSINSQDQHVGPICLLYTSDAADE